MTLFTAARAMLILDALIFFMVGTFLFTGPEGLAYLNIDTASGLTAIRTWGGTLVGVGSAGLLAAARPPHVREGLIMLLIIGSGIVLARSYGIVTDGVEPRQLSELRSELLGPVLALVGLACLWLQQRRDGDRRG